MRKVYTTLKWKSNKKAPPFPRALFILTDALSYAVGGAGTVVSIALAFATNASL